VCSSADSFMFVLRIGSHIPILLIYVDDIILTGSSSKLLHSFVFALSYQFDKDPGDLHYFLGIQVQRDSMSISLSQDKYVDDLLHKFHFHTVKLVTTPSAARILLSLTDGELLVDPTEYRNMVGALQYLTMTYFDIAYAIHVVFQFMHAPRTTHLHAVKRIFRRL